jgi:hypothetical protein
MVTIMNSPIVFLDTEATGLRLDDHAWDVAAIRREPDGTETEWQIFVQHDAEKAAHLPEPFISDYRTRYDGTGALAAASVAEFREWFADPVFAGRPHVVGAVPDFDITHMRKLLGTNRVDDPWHYHLIDVETLAVGYRIGLTAECDRDVPDLPWDSEALSWAVGVNPDQFARHTAMGDVLWTRAIYDVVMGKPVDDAVRAAWGAGS